MYYIYCYTNLLNQHKYVGQTNNFNRRVREHRSCSFNPKASSYNDLIHKKIREYGENNFKIEVLEILYTSNIEEVNEREQYWIQKLNTFRGNGKGYNSDLGGNRKEYNSILSKEQLQEVKNKIKNGVSYIDIQKEYNISASFISSINHGTYFKESDEEYPLFKYYKEDSDYDELIELLLNSPMSLTDIAKTLGLGYSTIKKINAGTLRKGLYPTYPIREKTANQIRAEKIKDLLLNSSLSKKEIAKITNSSDETVRRINIGETFKDNNLKYPLRSL